MKTTIWTFTHRQSLPSELGSGRWLMRALLRRMEILGWSRGDVFGVRLAVEEALANAVTHGNGLDRKRRIEVAYKLSAERIHLSVKDEGDGFKLNKVPDCTRKKNLRKPNGRGLLLMHQYMTRVRFRRPGNHVVMHKVRTATGQR